MITTLAALAAVCLLSLSFILVIPRFASTRVFMSFLPRDIREAAKAHPDPSGGKQVIGYLLTALAAAWVGNMTGTWTPIPKTAFILSAGSAFTGTSLRSAA